MDRLIALIVLIFGGIFLFGLFIQSAHNTPEFQLPIIIGAVLLIVSIWRGMRKSDNRNDD